LKTTDWGNQSCCYRRRVDGRGLEQCQPQPQGHERHGRWYAVADGYHLERAIQAAASHFFGLILRRNNVSTAWTKLELRFLQEKMNLARSFLAKREGPSPKALAKWLEPGAFWSIFASESVRINGERLDSVRSGIEVEILREPEGVIGIVTPRNFPIAIPAWKIAPAPAYGNTVVFKGRRSCDRQRMVARRYHLSLRHSGGRFQPRNGPRLGCRGRDCGVKAGARRGRQLEW
jgi:acyl-CoA reductase-like NAD-dependent aldehyde dehydrogenase